MSYFIFNSVDSRTYGILENCPVVSKSVRQKDVFNIPGKIHEVTIPRNTYDNTEIDCTLGLKNRQKLREIYAWLSESGTLLFSDEPNLYYRVIDAVLPAERLSVRFARINITFNCEPFAYLLDSPVLTLTDGTSYTEIENRGTIYCEPEIRFKPQSAQTVIDVNGAEFTVNTPQGCSFESTIVLDCEEETAYFIRPEGQAYPCLQYTYGDFPIFHTGKNYIKFTGTNEVEIKVRERCL